VLYVKYFQMLTVCAMSTN